jgi:hypothetical protein
MHADIVEKHNIFTLMPDDLAKGEYWDNSLMRGLIILKLY